MKELSEFVVDICKVFIGTASSVDIPEFLIEKSDLTESFFQYITDHKMWSMCLEVLQPSKDEILSENYHRLRLVSQKSAMRNLMLMREAKIVREVFERGGVTIMPYKGLTFSEIFYRKLGVRYSIDVDFAIDQDDLIKAADLMKSIDYHEIKGTIDREDARKSRAYYLDYPWRKVLDNGFNSIIEFHLAPAHKALFVPVGFRDMRSSRQVSREFSRVEHALFTIIHHGAVDLWGKLLHLVDLHQILNELDKEEQNLLINSCDRARIRKFFELGVHLNNYLFGTNFTLPFKYDLKPHQISKMANEIVQSKLNRNWSENPRILRYHMEYRDRYSDRFRSIGSLVRYMLFLKFGI